MTKLVYIGIFLILVGIFITILGATTSFSNSSNVRGGGVIMIGPIPIIFGSDPASVKVTMVLAIVLLILGIIYLLITLKGLW
jgi:uncharacterized protein (TIGR00304 family)